MFTEQTRKGFKPDLLKLPGLVKLGRLAVSWIYLQPVFIHNLVEKSVASQDDQNPGSISRLWLCIRSDLRTGILLSLYPLNNWKLENYEIYFFEAEKAKLERVLCLLKVGQNT